jgi:hypothetical protein
MRAFARALPVSEGMFGYHSVVEMATKLPRARPAASYYVGSALCPRLAPTGGIEPAHLHHRPPCELPIRRHTYMECYHVHTPLAPASLTSVLSHDSGALCPPPASLHAPHGGSSPPTGAGGGGSGGFTRLKDCLRALKESDPGAQRRALEWLGQSPRHFLSPQDAGVVLSRALAHEDWETLRRSEEGR